MVERKKPTSWLTTNFEFTYDLRWLLGLAVAFAVITSPYLAIKGKEAHILPVIVIIAVPLVILLVALITEVISKIIPGFQTVLKLIATSVKLVGEFYVIIGSFFLRPIVEYITEGKSAKNANVTLEKTPGHDDEYIEGTLGFEKIRNVKIKFSSKSAYWRFGIKFSRDENFNSDRLESSHPLFHLAKDETSNIIYRVYYDENKKQRQNENLVENYDGSPLILEIDKKDGLRITMKNAQGEELISEKFDLQLHKYGKVFAWGDGRDYKVKANIEKK